MAMAMRVGGGRLRGRRIAAPKGRETRPTSGRLKKSLLDVLVPRLPGARVLDLYAGAGALAIEALSRGAESAVLVERDRRAVAVIRSNLAELELDRVAQVVSRDVLAALSRLKGSFDVVFADPPYRSDEAERLLGGLGASELVAPEGILALEHHHKTVLAERVGSLERHRVLEAGESRVSLYTRLSGTSQ